MIKEMKLWRPEGELKLAVSQEATPECLLGDSAIDLFGALTLGIGSIDRQAAISEASLATPWQRLL